MTDKILCVQISNDLINGKPDLNDLSQRYYATLYNARSKQGYVKPYHFWELPNWVSVINYNTECDFYICTDIKETVNFIINHNYRYVCFSVLDVNKQIIKDIIKTYIETSFNLFWNTDKPIKQLTKFILGGYIDMHEYFNYLIRLHGVEYIKIFESIKNFIEFLGLNYKEGYNYSHFKDYEVIPRLTLSTGCLNNCTFCTIEKILKEVHIGTILRQTRSFKPLKFKLVYINDKTFGQCANYKLLPGLYREIKTYNKKFEGFIIQTTTSQFLKLDNEFIHEAHIKFIELGIETFNDPILKKYHKPSNEFLSEQSIDKIRELKTVQLIPNILIGIPEETEFTYARTLNFLNTHKNIISHLNIYNLAVYDNTPLSKTLKHTESDKNENSINKSFHKNKNIHIQFYKDVHEFGINILCEKKTI